MIMRNAVLLLIVGAAVASCSTGVMSGTSVTSPSVDIAGCLELLQGGKAAEAYPVLVKLHAEGNSEASRLLGLMYFKGDGVEHDPDKAVTYIKAASNAGNAEASFILADVQPTVEDHARVMLKAAEQGHLIAAQQAGLYYLEGHGIKQDKVQAYRWLFSIQLRTPVAVETFTKPLAQLEAELNDSDKERARVEAWNFVYVDTRSGWNQAEFNAANSNFTGRITVDNYKVVDGQLIVR